VHVFWNWVKKAGVEEREEKFARGDERDVRWLGTSQSQAM
jgi:hypothetical protein